MIDIKVGELLFYPLHGVGILEEEVTLWVENQQRHYYKLYFSELKMNILVPQESAEQLGVRPLSSLSILETSHIHFFNKFSKLPVLVSDRRKLLDSKLKSGEIFNLTEVIRDLVCASKYELKLTSHDKYSLKRACDLCINELMYVAKLPLEKAKSNVKKSIDLRLNGKKSDFTSLVREISLQNLKNSRKQTRLEYVESITGRSMN
ncbi:CarD family transcriptional regulator [Paenibacillus sp. FSL H8-0079]|uniref:CarD family transcriptional regulator n=1 Tax=Paenibacillus sp. FSL H8-0079 TaxID=2921375 RepID=UPI0030EC8096